MENKFSKEALSSIEKEVKAFRKRIDKHEGYLMCGAVLYFGKDGQLIHTSWNYQCYSCASRREPGVALIVCFDVHKGWAFNKVEPWTNKQDIPLENKERYLDWLINESVWKDVFIHKDPEIIIKSGAYINTSIPANLMMSGMIAFRNLTEHTHALNLWCDMTEDPTVNKALAFSLAHTCCFEKSNSTHFSRMTGDSGHVPLPRHTIKRDGLVSFCRGEIVKKELLPLYVKATYYTKIFRLFGVEAYSGKEGIWKDIFEAYPHSKPKEVGKDWEGALKYSQVISKKKLQNFLYFAHEFLGVDRDV